MSAAAPGFSTPSWSGKYFAPIFALFLKSISVTSHQPTFGQAVRCWRWDAEGDLKGFEHVVGVGVGAHAEEDAALVELEDGADADGVAHVGFRIVHAP